ncbi:hypothetical protein ACFT9M_11350 [Micromonospora purpureochromogenes]|uniref:hypothetical protein n=1 Tax=Micromonospora purpureochromogenes TaxID=47872 RepID=UPI003640C4BC
MTDLDQAIVSALRDRAEGAVDTRLLTARAVAGGQARRRRRRMAAGAALGLTAVLSVGVAAGPPESGSPPPAAAPVRLVVAPPRVDGIAGAATRPDLVGADPKVLHFGVDPARGRYLGWAVAEGVESVRIDVGSGRTVSVDLARSSSALSERPMEGLEVGLRELATEAAFDGRTVTVADGSRQVRVRHWQPSRGLYARAVVIDGPQAELLVAADALRWDEPRRCTAPIQLTTLPPGAAVASCRVDVSAFPGRLNGTLTLVRGTDQLMSVSLEYNEGIEGGRTAANRTVDGRPAYLYPTGRQLELLGIPKAHLTAMFGWPGSGFTEADAATALGGVRLADDLARPESWR